MFFNQISIKRNFIGNLFFFSFLCLFLFVSILWILKDSIKSWQIYQKLEEVVGVVGDPRAWHTCHGGRSEPEIINFGQLGLNSQVEESNRTPANDIFCYPGLSIDVSSITLFMIKFQYYSEWCNSKIERQVTNLFVHSTLINIYQRCSVFVLITCQ